eukprot:7969-Chlamydomonas_euryale.AAC.1
MPSASGQPGRALVLRRAQRRARLPGGAAPAAHPAWAGGVATGYVQHGVPPLALPLHGLQAMMPQMGFQGNGERRAFAARARCLLYTSDAADDTPC